MIEEGGESAVRVPSIRATNGHPRLIPSAGVSGVPEIDTFNPHRHDARVGADIEAAKGRMGTGRIDALSDGVFAVALTLLVFDVVAASKNLDPGESLSEHLVAEWPTLLAYFVGFATISVCWINHHCVFGYVTHTDSGLLWVNGFQLALVAAVPFPTAVLAQHINGSPDDRRTALLLYGIVLWLVATSFWWLWSYVDRNALTDRSVDPIEYRGFGVNYRLSTVWTIICLIVATLSVYPALVMWIVMFVVFAFPAEFARATGRRQVNAATSPVADTFTSGSSTIQRWFGRDRRRF